MYLKQIFLILCAIMFVSSELDDIEEMYPNIFVHIDSVNKSTDILKLRMEMEELKNCSSQHIDKKFSKIIEVFGVVNKSEDDVKLKIEVGTKNSLDKYIDMEDQKINLEILKKSHDDSKVRVDTMEDNFRKKIDEMEKKYSNMLDQLNNVKNSEDNLKLEINRFKIKEFDLKTTYFNILEIWEIAKKSEEALKSNVDVMADQISKFITNQETKKKFNQNPIFDARVDLLPEVCRPTKLSFDCKEVSLCKKSGYYEIFNSKNRSHSFMAFCDEKTITGGWLHILRRIDGSESFNRSWSDYVHGFGKVDGEYWIGLENLYALTNYNGRQELYIYIENFEGESRFARYDNFVIGNATEKYKLKSLGEYSGTAGDVFHYCIGKNFSTYENDYCIPIRKGGFWDECLINPTGIYLHGNRETEKYEGVYWYEFGGFNYSHKVMNFMIRRYKII